eukprot:3185685-Pleurochrysis_carterae.AAC.1
MTAAPMKSTTSTRQSAPTKLDQLQELQVPLHPPDRLLRGSGTSQFNDADEVQYLPRKRAPRTASSRTPLGRERSKR